MGKLKRLLIATSVSLFILIIVDFYYFQHRLSPATGASSQRNSVLLRPFDRGGNSAEVMDISSGTFYGDKDFVGVKTGLDTSVFIEDEDSDINFYELKLPVPKRLNKTSETRPYVLPSDSEEAIEHPINEKENSATYRRERYIIYYCHEGMKCCGWGDRQRGILTTYLLSLVTNRTFGVDMTTPCPLTKFFHSWKLNLTANLTFQGVSPVYVNTVGDKGFRNLMFYINFDVFFPQDVIYLTVNHDYFFALKENPHYKSTLQQEFKGKSHAEVFAYVWRNIFKLNKSVQTKLNIIMKEAKPTPHVELVCAHIRMGRNPLVTWKDPKVINTMESIDPVWDFFKVYNDTEKYRIFIASDMENVRSKGKELFPSQIIETEGEIIHIDRVDSIAADPCVGFERVVIDEYLLSMCDVLVLTNSSFSRAAGYLKHSRNDLYLLKNGTLREYTDLI